MQNRAINQGHRIIKLRRITRLSRRAFGEKHNISSGTLQNWEIGRYQGLTSKAADVLIKAFAAEGINCSKDWLLNGKGEKPSHHFLANNSSPPTSNNTILENEIIKQTQKNAERFKANTALYNATKSGRFATVEKLIESGSTLHLYEGLTIHPYDNDENTPLHIAALNGHLDIVKLLIEHGSKVGFRNRSKQTPLHLAVHSGHKSVIDYLVSEGADINAVEIEGDSPLAWAAYTGQTNILKHLIKLGARINIKNQNNNKALHWAAYKGHTDIVELLINSPSTNPNEKNSRGETPLDCAVSTGQMETVLFLLYFKK